MDEETQRLRAGGLAYRPLVPACAAFVAGVALREWAGLPRVAVWGAAGAAAVAWPVAARIGLRSVALLALHLLIAAAGWVRLDLAAAGRPGHHIARFLGEAPRLVKVRGVVASDPELRTLPPMPLSGDSAWLAAPEVRMRFDLEVREVEVNRVWLASSGRLRVVKHGVPVPLHYGESLVAMGMARRPAPPSNPGQVDSATLLRRRGIDATLSVSEGGVAVEGRGRTNPLLGFVYGARQRFRETLQTDLAPDERSASLLCALTLGDRTALDEELEDAFSRTGTMHLLAVSGLNVGIVAWLVWWLTALAGLGRRVSGCLVLGAVTLYALLTGAPPSVVRAAAMAGAFVLGILGRRQVDPLQCVAAAALVLLAARPYDLFNVGFQLSFVAVTSLICLSGDLGGLLRPRESILARAMGEEEVGRWTRLRRFTQHQVARAVGASTAAWLGVIPLTALYFNTFSPITVLVNLAAVPLAGVLTALGFVHLGVAELSHAAAALVALPARGDTWALVQVVRAADRLPMAWSYCAAPALGWVVAYYALGLVVVARRRLGLGGRRAAVLWLSGVLVYLVAGSPGRAPDGLEMTALDVQHGNATVLRFPDGATVLYDCGSYGRTDVGRWTAAPALWHAGVRTIDLLVVTHADADHLNGIPSLLERFRIGHVVYGPVLPHAEAGRQLIAMLDKRGIPHEAAWAGERLEVGDGNALDVLWPMPWSLRLRPDDQNENSLVLRTEHAGRRILLGADVQQVAAAVLLRSGLDLRADVLLVPHHGCANPLSEDLARAVRPAYAICSSRSDHLVPATVAAYEGAGAQVLATCWDGAISVTIHGGEVEASTWRARDGSSRVTRDP